MRQLFVSIGDLQQRRLRPRTPINAHARGKRAPASKTHGDIDGRETRGRRVELAIITCRRVEIADQTRRIAPRRIEQRLADASCVIQMHL